MITSLGLPLVREVQCRADALKRLNIASYLFPISLSNRIAYYFPPIHLREHRSLPFALRQSVIELDKIRLNTFHVIRYHPKSDKSRPLVYLRLKWHELSEKVKRGHR